MALPATRKSGNKTRKSTPSRSIKSRIASTFKRKAAGAKDADTKASFAGDHSEITSIMSSMEREAKKLHTLMKDPKYKKAAIKHAASKGTVNKKEFAKQGQMIRGLLESTLPEMVGSYSSYVKDYLDAAEQSRAIQKERLQKERAKQDKKDAKQAKKDAKKDAKETKKQQKAAAKTNKKAADAAANQPASTQPDAVSAAASDNVKPANKNPDNTKKSKAATKAESTNAAQEKASQKAVAAETVATNTAEDATSSKDTTAKKRGGVRGRIKSIKSKASSAKASVVSAIKKRTSKGKDAAAKELQDAEAAKDAAPADVAANKKGGIRGKFGNLKRKAGTAIRKRASSLKRKTSSGNKSAVADSNATEKASDDAKRENVVASQAAVSKAASASEKTQKSSKGKTQEPKQAADKQVEDDAQPKNKTNSKRITTTRRRFAKQKGVSANSANARSKKKGAANNEVSHYAVQDNLAASNSLAGDDVAISRKTAKSGGGILKKSAKMKSANSAAMSDSAEGIDGLLQNLEMLETRMRRQRLVVEKRRERVRILKKRLYNSSVKVQQISAKMLSVQQAQADSLQKHLRKTEEGHESDIDDTMASFNSGEHEKYAQSVAKMAEELRQEKAANLLIKQELVKNKRHLRFSEVKLMSSVETRARMLKEAQKMESKASELPAKEGATQKESVGATKGLKGVSVADDSADNQDHAKGKNSFVGRLRASNKSSGKDSGRQH